MPLSDRHCHDNCRIEQVNLVCLLSLLAIHVATAAPVRQYDRSSLSAHPWHVVTGALFLRHCACRQYSYVN